MKNYLSYGGGVNSTALLLLLHEQEIEHEAVFVDHGGDWPETYEYVEMLRQKYPITVIKPNCYRKKDDRYFSNLMEYNEYYQIMPFRMNRYCTQIFKVEVLQKYFEKPCFVMIGIDAGESKRAKISSDSGIEHRWPLIEYDIDRHGCIEIIKRHGLSVPMKSGCWFCPFQKISQFKELRMKHPDLFCKVNDMEQKSVKRAIERGKKPFYLKNNDFIKNQIDNHKNLFEELEYPPCQCGL